MSDIEIVAPTTEEKNGRADAALMICNHKGKPFFIDVYSDNDNFFVVGVPGIGKIFNMAMYTEE